MRFGIYMRGVRSGRGAEKVATRVAIALAARGHGLDLLLEDGAGRLPEQAASAGVRVRDLRAQRLGPVRERALQLAALGGMLASPAGWRSAGLRGAFPLAQLALGDDPPIGALLRYVREERPDAVLSFLNYPNFALLLASRLARGRTRFVVSVRNHVSSASARGSRWNRSVPDLMRRCLPSADAIVVPSRGVADDVRAITGLPEARVRVIHNPVEEDAAELAKEPLLHPFFAEPRVPVLVAAGKLKPQKDFETLLRAFRIARDARPMRLVILGEGDPARLRALARELDVEPDVDWPGHVENPFAWFGRAALYVLSSAWEGFPNVLLEALACGCPVVATDCPSGPAEILEGGKYGKLVPVGAAGDLAKAILETLEAPPSADRLIARSREFGVTRAIDAYEELLTTP